MGRGREKGQMSRCQIRVRSHIVISLFQKTYHAAFTARMDISDISFTETGSSQHRLQASRGLLSLAQRTLGGAWLGGTTAMPRRTHTLTTHTSGRAPTHAQQKTHTIGSATSALYLLPSSMRPIVKYDRRVALFRASASPLILNDQ